MDQFQDFGDSTSDPACKVALLTLSATQTLSEMPNALYVYTGGHVRLKGIDDVPPVLFRNAAKPSTSSTVISVEPITSFSSADHWADVSEDATTSLIEYVDRVTINQQPMRTGGANRTHALWPMVMITPNAFRFTNDGAGNIGSSGNGMTNPIGWHKHHFHAGSAPHIRQNPF